jgi:hypothetical protein
MNIFGFFAVLIICAALVTIVYFICDSGIVIHKSYEDITKRPQVAQPVEEKQKKQEKQEKDVAVESMDAVIQAANALMGIETIDRGNNK